jgi:hypothetical protein
MSQLTSTYTTKSFAGKIIKIDGHTRWRPDAPFWYEHELRKFKEGEPVTAYYTSKRPKRTELQNRYYWGVYLPLISEETGNDIDDLHTLFKGKFLSKEVVQVLGESVRRVRSTASLSSIQFGDYIRRIEELTGVLAPPTEDHVVDPKVEEEKEELEYPEYEGPAKF